MSKTLSRKPLHAHTFLTLEALRGIAALAVVIFHEKQIIGHLFFAHAYLAVDFFFMLSGFVLSYAYQRRLDTGLSSLDFMKVRLIRLYPLYFVATLAGFLYAMVTFLHTGQIGVAKYLRDLVLSLLFIPTPRPADFPGIAAFPYNSFAWSIFYELVANLVHTTLLRRRSTRFLLIMAAAVGLPLCVTIVRLGADTYGTLTQDIPVGLLRVMFSYLVGMLLFRLWSRYRDRHMLSPFWSVLLLLTTISISVSPQHNAVFDILVLLLVLPNVVLLGVFSQPSGFVRPMATLLGVLSYGLYILSAPMMIYVSRAWDYLLKRPAASMTPWSGIAAIAILFLVAWLADAVYDLPLRRWLRKRYGA